MAASSLPLLRLPSETIMKVLKSMDTVDQIAISFVSKAAKSLIISLNIEVAYTDIVITDTLILCVQIRNCFLKWHFRHADLEANEPVKLVKEDNKSDWRLSTYEWKKEGFGVKNWIRHLFKVANILNIRYLDLDRTGEQFSISFLKEMVQGLNIQELLLSRACSNAYCQLVLETLKARKLRMYRNPYEDRRMFQKNLMENFEALEFALGISFTLDDLLAMNTPTIHTRTPQNITIKVLNRFIKCWKTGSNRQLRYLTIAFENDIVPDIKEVLRGIKYTEYSEYHTREFEVPLSAFTPWTVNGGYDICAFDGRKATVSIKMQILIHMIVWPF